MSQTIEQQQQQPIPQSQSQTHQQLVGSNKKAASTAQSLLNHASSFLPPLFNLPFVNLRQDIRNELLNDEKTASLLLGSFNRNQAQASSKMAAGNSSSVNTKNAPPPAHQSSSTRRNNPLDTLDLRFKTNPVLVAPPAPAHKTPPKQASKPRTTPSSSQSVLDLSSGPPPDIKRTTRSSMPSAPPKELSAPNVPSVSTKRSGKRIGSRIDALALNLQAKKMMEEKTEPRESSLLEQLTKSSKRDFEREIDKQLSQKQSSHQTLSNLLAPPVAHSTMRSKSNMGDLSSVKAFNQMTESKPASKSNEASSILEQAAAIRQDLKKWLEDHPEFVAANPSLAAAAAAAMAFNPPTISSSIPANVNIQNFISDLN